MTARRRVEPFTPQWFGASAVQARQRVTIKQVLDVRRLQYAQTKNPVYVWSALGFALDNHRRVPDWVRDYLAEVAAKIDTLSRRQIPRKNDLPRAVYGALGFGRRGTVVNPFAQQTDQWHRLNIALEVWWRLGALEKLDAAIHHVVQTHSHYCKRQPPCRRISRSTVLRAWHTYKRLVVVPDESSPS